MSYTVNKLLNKVSDFDNCTQKEQIKLIAFFHCVVHSKQYFTPSEIKEEFEKQALPLPSNLSREISKLKKAKPQVFLSNGRGLTFHRTCRQGLEKVFLGNKHRRDVSVVLRDILEEVNGEEQKNFLEEAISCFEIKSFRAAIILTWLLTVDTLYEFVLKKRNLQKFNTAIQKHGKYKKIKVTSKDDLSDIRESNFIELLRVAKFITNDIRKILDEKLGVRNSCAHPNLMTVKEYKVIAFIQDLASNVVKKYQ